VSQDNAKFIEEYRGVFPLYSHFLTDAEVLKVKDLYMKDSMVRDTRDLPRDPKSTASTFPQNLTTWEVTSEAFLREKGILLNNRAARRNSLRKHKINR
jgi:hypothetical protein